jgi:hypothetical protein
VTPEEAIESDGVRALVPAVTTLMVVYDADSIVGQCDSRCYDAARRSASRCGCVCGGANHGAGLRRAARNTYKHWGRWLDHAVEASPSIVAADIFPGLRP